MRTPNPHTRATKGAKSSAVKKPFTPPKTPRSPKSISPPHTWRHALMSARMREGLIRRRILPFGNKDGAAYCLGYFG
jgi:hypothetical protein